MAATPQSTGCGAPRKEAPIDGSRRGIGLRVAIITGVSRGLGRALLDLAADAYDGVVAIGRSRPQTALGRKLSFIAVDLAAAGTDWETLLTGDRLIAAARELVFFDNAGVLALAATTGGDFPAALAEAFTVNVEAPAAIAGVLARWCEKLTIVHVTTGAARRPIAGWGAYCTSKAASAMLYDILALEQPAIKVHKIDPGAIDTDMQASIRDAEAALVPARGEFRALFDQGRLISPADAAAKILAVVEG